jgi:hypothetical protein
VGYYLNLDKFPGSKDERWVDALILMVDSLIGFKD